jgi:hypothetical protein
MGLWLLTISIRGEIPPTSFGYLKEPDGPGKILEV